MRRKGKMHDPDLKLGAATLGRAHGVHAVKFELKDGEIFRSKTGKIFPLPEQEIFAKELTGFLNREIAHGGSWRVVLTQPADSHYDKLSGIFRIGVPELVECQFMDKDGDVQFVMDMEEDVWDLLDNFSFTSIVERAEQSYIQWREIMMVVDPQEYQMYSPVHGQQEKNPGEQIPGLI